MTENTLQRTQLCVCHGPGRSPHIVRPTASITDPVDVGRRLVLAFTFCGFVTFGGGSPMPVFGAL